MLIFFITVYAAVKVRYVTLTAALRFNLYVTESVWYFLFYHSLRRRFSRKKYLLILV